MWATWRVCCVGQRDVASTLPLSQLDTRAMMMFSHNVFYFLTSQNFPSFLWEVNIDNECLFYDFTHLFVQLWATIHPFLWLSPKCLKFKEVVLVYILWCEFSHFVKSSLPNIIPLLKFVSVSITQNVLFFLEWLLAWKVFLTGKDE